MAYPLTASVHNVRTLEESPAYAFMLEFDALSENADPNHVKDRGIDLVQRWIKFLPSCDPLGFGASKTTILSLISELNERGLQREEREKIRRHYISVIGQPPKGSDFEHDFNKTFN